jgi:hypothetical protein
MPPFLKPLHFLQPLRIFAIALLLPTRSVIPLLVNDKDQVADAKGFSNAGISKF